MKMALQWMIVAFLSLTFHLSESASIPNFQDLIPGTRTLSKSPSRGGRLEKNGSVFDDMFSCEPFVGTYITGISSITISHSTLGLTYVAIQVTYGLANGSHYKAPQHGSVLSGQQDTISMAEDQHVSKVEWESSGDYISQITITTTQPNDTIKVFGPYGEAGSMSFGIEGHIVGFHGRDSFLYLYSLGTYSFRELERGQESCGDQGYAFNDVTSVKVPPIVGISRLFIWHSDAILGLQVEYWLLGGTLELYDRRGGNGGNLTVISFEWGEQLEKITASCDLENQSTLIQLTLTTRHTHRGGGREVNYGPFGSYYPRRTFIYGNVYGSRGEQIKGKSTDLVFTLITAVMKISGLMQTALHMRKSDRYLCVT